MGQGQSQETHYALARNTVLSIMLRLVLRLLSRKITNTTGPDNPGAKFETVT
jgi:hypothetical protein